MTLTTSLSELQRETLHWLEVLANTPGVGNNMNAWQHLSSRVVELCRPSSQIPSQDENHANS